MKEQQITPCLNNDAEEAMKLYTSVFKDSKVGKVSYYGEGAPLPNWHPDRASSVRISCRQERNYAVLQVKDNGLGLNLEQQRKLFTMFRRFHDHVEAPVLSFIW